MKVWRSVTNAIGIHKKPALAGFFVYKVLDYALPVKHNVHYELAKHQTQSSNPLPPVRGQQHCEYVPHHGRSEEHGYQAVA